MGTKPDAVSQHIQVVVSKTARLPDWVIRLSDNRKHLMKLIGKGIRGPLLEALCRLESAVVTYVQPFAQVCRAPVGAQV